MDVKTKQSKLAATALIYQQQDGSKIMDSKLLGVSRKDNHELFGLPGGKVDEGETLYDAMVREVKEETNIDVLSAIPIYFREDGDFLAVVFLVTKWEGEVSSVEAGKVDWITFEELKQGSFPEYNTKLEEQLNYLRWKL
jgi:mutator protein MutT